MARGRKPKEGAQRRGGLIPSKSKGVTLVTEARPMVAMPDRVASNPALAAKWDAYIATTGQFRPEDAPLLESWCLWAVVADQCARDLDDDATPDLLRKAEKATTMLMRLGDQLGLSPVARQRAGIIEAAKQTAQVDMVSKTIASFAQLKRLEDEKKQV